ncbi:alpha/beta fold hydrolase [Ramlibacter rhizophilus]|uniref:Alpha/beta hydrolase n=1 Tax=Ramlibacter rhizophilus TaxID=1781167 RepID=A0A4Z0BUE4_9BURK|nr:alpha/beta hydrolase [Ramlibacter rhizophilus]TFZ01635.1 alpha/beta hydrolase [Ramlibacter rhizophilus]
MRAPGTWVLLRGLARESGHWGDFAQRLAGALGPGHRVLTPDLPGLGARHAEPSPASVRAMVAALRESLARERADGPMQVVALSLGAMVALEWARVAPHEARACALVNTSLARFSPPWARLRPVHWPRILGLLLPGVGAPRRERAILGMTSAAPERHGQALARWTALAQQHPVTSANVLRQLVAAARYRAPARPPVPLLVLCSAGDRLVSPRCSHDLARHWDLPLREHPWAGHDLPLDDPAWLIGELRGWAAARGPHPGPPPEGEGGCHLPPLGEGRDGGRARSCIASPPAPPP